MSAQRFALLVGVSDYRAFDHSAGQPRGSSDLFGPPQNLAAMWDFCLGLGFSAADIALLGSPLTPPRGGRPALYATATRESVLDGVRMLAERLAAADEAQGLIYFSGHGDEVEGIGPVLCTEDTVAGDGCLRHYVALAEIAAVLETHAPRRAVTLILDACDSGTPSPGATRAFGRIRTVARLRDHDTLISATPPGRTGMEVCVDGVWRGALTWALCTAVAPYARKLQGGFVVPDVSVGGWVERARLLLRGLSVGQRPEHRGDAHAIVLQPSGVPPIPVTNRLADQRRANIEIWGDETGQIYDGDDPVWFRFLIRDGAGVLIGSLLTSYATPSTTMQAYSDFWSWTGTAWPSTFRVDFDGVGTAGVNAPPSSMPPSMPMMAFGAGLTQSAFGGQSTSGWQVWGISESSVPGTFLGYVLRNATTGALKWLITWPGYSQRGHFLSALPTPNANGGVELGDDGESLWFLRISVPPATLMGVLAAYDVRAAAS